MLRLFGFIVLLNVLLACGRENAARNTQFDLLEQSANAEPIKYFPRTLQRENMSLTYVYFGGHAFSQLMQHLVKRDTLGVFCVGQKDVKIKYNVLWATDKVLSLEQEVWMDCPMADGKRKAVLQFLFTIQDKRIYQLHLEGSPGLLQDIKNGLRKRETPYCSAPKIEEVFPVIRAGRLEVTPHYASSLCDTTFKRKGISRTDLRLISNKLFLKLR